MDNRDKVNEVSDGPLCSLGKNITHEDDSVMGSFIIKTGDDGGGVRQFVLLEEPIESILQDFSVCHGAGSHKEYKQGEEDLHM